MSPVSRFYLPKPSMFGFSVPVASNTRMPALDDSDGVLTEAIYRTRHKLVCDATGFRLAYQNVVNGSPVNADPITVKAAFDSSTYSSPWAVTWSGADSAVIAPGGVAISDPIDLRQAAGDAIFVRTYVTVTSGDVWPINLSLTQTGEGKDEGTGADAELTSGTVTEDTSSRGFGPCAILGTPAPGQFPVIVAAMGDSIVESDDNAADGGFIQRAFNASPGDTGAPLAAIIQTSLGGDGATSLTESGGQTRWNLMACATHGIDEYGVNDLIGGANLATMQARLLSIATNGADRGIRMFRTTVTPSTSITGTDETTRTSLNDWLLAGAPIDPDTKAAVTSGTAGALVAGDDGHPMAGVLDVAAVIVVGDLSDGTHPTPTQHQLMADAIDLTLFGLS